MNNDKLNLPLPVSIVVLSYNKLSDLSNNLPQLLSEKNSPDEFELIVVDNVSTDGSREYLIELKKQYPEIILVLNEINNGVGGGRNSGWKLASREFIIALDDDSSIKIEDVRQIPYLFKKYHDAGILAFRVIHPITHNLQNPHGLEACEVANHHGSGFALRRSIFNQIGGNDEAVLYGADELEFSIRVYAHGWKVIYIPELTIYHNVTKKSNPTELFLAAGYIYGNVRLLFKFFPKYMATRNSIRYCIITSRFWLSEFGFLSLKKLIITYLRARKEGVQNHQKIPNKTIKFYNSSKLLPEFGNVPLHTKLIQLLRKNND